jgi:F0F1-type ATP synthase membrane subunit b/b'
MANPRRRRWGRREPDLRVAASQEQGSSEDVTANPFVGRLEDYYGTEDSAPAAEGDDEHGTAEALDSAEPELPTDLSDVGEEVGAVLKSAREAASRIRSAAQEESRRVRLEARSAAEAEVAEARRLAAADRAEAERARGEAEVYAEETRGAAEAYAEETRSTAEQEAAEIAEDANKRLEAADAKVEQKLRQIEWKARVRLDTLEADTRRYEERLESMLAVCQGMSLQLEELLGTREAEERGEPETEGGTLDDALQPDSLRSSSR